MARTVVGFLHQVYCSATVQQQLIIEMQYPVPKVEESLQTCLEKVFFKSIIPPEIICTTLPKNKVEPLNKPIAFLLY